jgi:hypothetical protein
VAASGAFLMALDKGHLMLTHEAVINSGLSMLKIKPGQRAYSK